MIKQGEDGLNFCVKPVYIKKERYIAGKLLL